MVNMEDVDVRLCRAIVKFGPATAIDGFRPAEYFQVTIDPNMVSPSGKFIRFGFYDGDEIVGWQRIAAMTVCEILSEKVDDLKTFPSGYEKTDKTVLMKKVI